jgi:hypothetical protein
LLQLQVSHIDRAEQGAFPAFELMMTDAKANLPLDAAVPDSVWQAAPST